MATIQISTERFQQIMLHGLVHERDGCDCPCLSVFVELVRNATVTVNFDMPREFIEEARRLR